MALSGCEDGGFIFEGKVKSSRMVGGREEGAVHHCGQVDGCLLSTLLDWSVYAWEQHVAVIRIRNYTDPVFSLALVQTPYFYFLLEYANQM